MPDYLEVTNLAAVALICVCWFGYSTALERFAKGSLNSQLATVRQHWVRAMTYRVIRPFDAILIGHMTNAIAFFGSATLIVLAGVLTIFGSVGEVHDLISRIRFVRPVSLELFELKIGVVAAVLALCFFSFTYALRQLVYLIALVGALPHQDDNCPTEEALISSTASVMSEAVRTFNFGIRGFYYAVAAVCLVASAELSIFTTLLVTATLVYRQVATRTSYAIQAYVEAAKAIEPNPNRIDAGPAALERR